MSGLLAEQERVVHFETRGRRWKCYIRIEGDGVSYGVYSRRRSVRGVGGWMPENFETAPAGLIASARARARRLTEGAR